MEEEFLKKLEKEYSSGKSLNELNKKYNVPKSTIYYNLSKKELIRRMNIINNLNCDNETLIGTFVGIWAGDGSRFRDRGRYVTKIHLHKENKKLILFVEKVIIDLFGKKASLCLDGGNRVSLRLYNKFIHSFIEKYLSFRDNKKCLSVSLKNSLNDYTKDFIDGFILGLTLSDGSIKRGIFVYSTISKNLRKDVFDILNSKNYPPKLYIHKRAKYGWHDLNQVKLGRSLTNEIICELNYVISQLGYKKKIEELKTK